MNRILFLLLACCLVWGCKKKDDAEPMPSPTQSGKNIIACKVNGKVTIYSGTSTPLHDDGVLFGKYLIVMDTFLKVEGNESVDHNDDVSLFINDVNPKIGTEYRFSTETEKSYARYYVGNGDNDETYLTKNNSGYVKFTRYDNAVASGTFELTAYNPDGITVKITEGFLILNCKKYSIYPVLHDKRIL